MVLLTRGLFITGTNTDVGKTCVGTALAWQLSRRGLTVRPRKPVESGCPESEDGLYPQDGAAYRAAVGNTEPLARICRYRLQAPLSPERAAALQGVEIRLQDLVEACREGVQAEDFLLVEGAGGFYSPLTMDGLNADLAMVLGLPALLVTTDWLGTIHQTLVTAEAIARRGLTLTGVVLNEVTPVPDPRMDNAADLARWLGQEVIAVRHYGTPGLATWHEIAPVLTVLADRLANDTKLGTKG